MVLKYLSLFSEFNKVTLVTGSNKHMSLGLHIQKDFQNFYNMEEAKLGDNLSGMNPDVAVRELFFLSKKSLKDNDDLLLFQSLMQKWQDSLVVQRT